MLRLIAVESVLQAARDPHGACSPAATRGRISPRLPATILLPPGSLPAKRGSRRLTKQVEAVLGALIVRSLESDVERVYAAIRVALEKKSSPIGAHDMLIAAHARAIDAVCVTDNVAEFKRVPALKVENWVR